MNVAPGYRDSLHYNNPHFYDLVGIQMRRDTPYVEFHLGYARRAGRALEIGAGTGCIALELAAEGVHVHCVEPSAAMRSALLTKVAQRPEVHPYITLIAAEGEAFELTREVPLAYASGVLQHFLTDEEMLAMLSNVHRHLEPGGLFLSDAMGAQEAKSVAPTVVGERRVGEMLYRATYETKALSPDHYKFEIFYETFHGERLIERAGERTVNRYVRREAMHGLLEKAGFEVAGEVVAYDGAPFTGREDRVVIEARRHGP